jgi:hypothetical protein
MFRRQLVSELQYLPETWSSSISMAGGRSRGGRYCELSTSITITFRMRIPIDAPKSLINLLRFEINTNKHIMEMLCTKEYLQINGKYLVPKNDHILGKKIITIILLDDNVNINMRIL